MTSEQQKGNVDADGVQSRAPAVQAVHYQIMASGSTDESGAKVCASWEVHEPDPSREDRCSRR